MSRLSDREFKAMNTAGRRLLQRWWEFPILKRLGVPITGQDVLEIGCGSGYGARLLSTLKPRSYIGFDLMPEQIALACRNTPECTFIVQDATNLKEIPEICKDVVVDFGILHHIPEWKTALKEIARVLRPGGTVYVEEPDGGVIDWFDRQFKWGHPVTFRLTELENHLHESNFKLLRKTHWFGFGFYRFQKN